MFLVVVAHFLARHIARQSLDFVFVLWNDATHMIEFYCVGHGSGVAAILKCHLVLHVHFDDLVEAQLSSRANLESKHVSTKRIVYLADFLVYKLFGQGASIVAHRVGLPAECRHRPTEGHITEIHRHLDERAGTALKV